MLNSPLEWKSQNVSDYRGDEVMADEILKRGDYWYAKKRIYKKVTIPFQSLKTPDEDEARERLLEIKILIRMGEYQKHLLKFDDLVAQYDPQVDRVNKLRNLKNHLIPAFAGKRLNEIDIQAWAEMIASKYKESTALHIMRPANEMGLGINYKVLKLVPNKKFDGSQILSEEMAMQVLNTLRNSYAGKMYAPLFHIALYSTMPLSDLVHMKKSDVVFTGPDAGITYTRRKTRHKDKPAIFIPMTNKLREAFATQPTPIRPEDTWFPQWNSARVSKTVGRAFKTCGWLHGRAMHNARHFGACYLIRQGVPLTTIKELMGHSDFNTTLIYARVDRDKLKEGMRKFDAK
jgi:integrase